MPFAVKCDNCAIIIPEGKRFNAKRIVLSQKFKGVEVFAFIIRCQHCYSFFKIKTNPKSADYKPSSGCKKTQTCCQPQVVRLEKFSIDELKYEAILMANTNPETLKMAFVEKKSIHQINREHFFNTK